MRSSRRAGTVVLLLVFFAGGAVVELAHWAKDAFNYRDRPDEVKEYVSFSYRIKKAVHPEIEGEVAHFLESQCRMSAGVLRMQDREVALRTIKDMNDTTANILVLRSIQDFRNFRKRIKTGEKTDAPNKRL